MPHTSATAMLSIICGLAFAAAGATAAPPRTPTTFPETTALNGELGGVRDQLVRVSGRLERANGQVEAARKKVKEASDLVKQVGQADDNLGKVIKELKTLSAIPQLRMLPPVVKNLEAIKKQLHAVRLKGDQFDKDVLKPLDARLKEVRDDLLVAIAGCKTTATDTLQVRDGIGEAQRLIRERGRRAQEVSALESAASAARRGVVPVGTALAQLDRVGADIEKQVATLAAALKAMTALRPGIVQFNKDLKPFNDAAAELKKVMTTKVRIKLLGIDHAFTVREVLEGPKNVADIVMKPLEELANAAIAEVMKALKLKIQAPAEVRELAEQLEKVAAAAAAFASVKKPLNTQPLATFQKSLADLPKRRGG